MTHLVINIIILLFLCFSFTLSYSEGSKAAANPGLLGISGPAVRLTQRVLLPNRYELNRSPQTGGEFRDSTGVSSSTSVTFLPFLFLTFLPNLLFSYYPSFFLPSLPFISLFFLHFLSLKSTPSHSIRVNVKVPKSLYFKHHAPSSYNHCQHDDHFCFDDSCTYDHTHHPLFDYLPDLVLDGVHYLLYFIRFLLTPYRFFLKYSLSWYNYFFVSEYITLTYIIPS